MHARTQVAIVGAGPAGLLLAHLLAAEGVESVVVETRSEEYVAARIRAGILEQSTVDLLRAAGLTDRLDREGDEHRGIHLQWHDGERSERHHLDFVELTGRSVWVYGQTEVQKDLVSAAAARGQVVHYEVADTALHDLDSDRPSVTYTRDGAEHRLTADAVVGCDGSFGPARSAVPDPRTWERTYPYSWLGVLADVPPSSEELVYARHPDGFALHSMRSATVSRFYLQVPNGTDLADWSDDRIWSALGDRFALDGWTLRTGPVTDRSVLPMRSFVQTPMRHGRLFLAGDAAHTVPPTGAKGLNLAVADVALLAPALVAWLRDGDPRRADAYAETALRRVWRCTHFSWWMTTMLHPTGDPFDDQLQLAQLRWVTASVAGATGLAENYAGLPIGAPVSETWDAQAATFDDEPDHGLRDPATRAAWRALLLRHLPAAPARVADLGCGTGTLSALLAEAGYAVDGVDFSPEMVRRARAKADTATFVVGDAAAPPLGAGRYDVVLCRHVLWALPDQPAALERWVTLLRPGGRLLLVEGHWHTGAGLSAAATEALLRGAGREPATYRLEDPAYWGGPITDERYLTVG